MVYRDGKAVKGKNAANPRESEYSESGEAV